MKNKAILIISKAIKEQGINKGVYFVGGTVRDLFLSKDIDDYDLCGNVKPEEFQAIFGGKITDKLGTVFTEIGGYEIEYTPFRKESNYNGRTPGEVEFGVTLEEDCKRRDFTANALYLDLDGNVIDIVGGINDINNKVLRALPPPRDRYTEDNLRLLRAIRFIAKYGFEIEEETAFEIKRMKNEILNLSGFRIHQELLKGFKYPNYVKTLLRFGLLEVLFPIIGLMKGLEQNTPHHKYDVLKHSLKSLDTAYKHFPNKSPIFYFTVFFHDIGKPKQFMEQRKYEPGTKEFKNARKEYNHALEGVIEILPFLKRYKFTNKEIDLITFLIKYHQTEFLYERFNRNKKGLRKFLSKHNISFDKNFNYFQELLDLAFCDRMGTGTRKVKQVREWQEEINGLIKEIKDEDDAISIKDLKINGNDLIKLGFKGREIGIILNRLLKKVLENPKINKKKLLEKNIS